jgi:hypothetical protein
MPRKTSDTEECLTERILREAATPFSRSMVSLFGTAPYSSQENGSHGKRMSRSVRIPRLTYAYDTAVKAITDRR